MQMPYCACAHGCSHTLSVESCSALGSMHCSKQKLLTCTCHLTTCSMDSRCHANQPQCSYRCIPLHLPSPAHIVLHWSSERSGRWYPHSWQRSRHLCTGSQHLCVRPPQTHTHSQSTLHKGRGRAANKTFWSFQCEAMDGYESHLLLQNNH